MKKKLIISLSIVFGVIAVILILLWTLFGLSKVTVSLSSTTENLQVSEAEIVKAGKFKKRACVLFEGKEKSIKRIENYVSKNENFAYIKVLNIETVFPNKFVIHIVEREEFFAVEYEEGYLICDRDLRVLKKHETYVSNQTNAILVEGLSIKNKSVKVGDFLNVGEKGIKKLYSAFTANNRNFNEQRAKFEKIVVSNYQDEFTKERYDKVELQTFSGRVFEILNIDFALENKIQLMFAVETSLLGQNFNDQGEAIDKEGNNIFLTKTTNGEYKAFDETKDSEDEKIAFSLEILAKSKIRVDNLTLSKYVKRTEKDIYYALVEIPNGQPPEEDPPGEEPPEEQENSSEETDE